MTRTDLRDVAGSRAGGLSSASPLRSTTGDVSGVGPHRLHLLTSSRLRTAQECPRRHLYRYEFCRTPYGTSRASELGTAVHAGLEAWWIAIREGAAQYALASALSAAEAAYPTDDAYAAALLRALVFAYDARWSEWAQTCEVIGVEVAFEAPLRHPTREGVFARSWRVAGKIDALVRLADGRVAIVEHKTTSMDASAGSDYRRKLTLDPQVSTYFDGAEALGLKADLCLYDVLRKPAIKPLLATPEEDRIYSQPKSRACRECKKAEKNRAPLPHIEDGLSCENGRIATDPGGKLRSNQREHDETATQYEARLIETIAADPEKHLLHAEIVRSDEEREAHAWALWHAVRQIEDTRRAYRESGCDARAVPQNPGACLTRGRCDFLDVCEGTASVTDDARFKALETAHPELPELSHDNATT